MSIALFPLYTVLVDYETLLFEKIKDLAVADELEAIAVFYRTVDLSSDDSRDDCARVAENRARELRKRHA